LTMRNIPSVSGWAGNTRQTRPVVMAWLSRPKRAESESETWVAAAAGPGIPGGGRTPPPGLGGTMAAGAIDGGTMVGETVAGAPDEPPLGASWPGDGLDDGRANWAVAVPGHPTSPKTRAPNSWAASKPPAP
jgi:hypothetical protein